MVSKKQDCHINLIPEHLQELIPLFYTIHWKQLIPILRVTNTFNYTGGRKYITAKQWIRKYDLCNIIPEFDFQIQSLDARHCCSKNLIFICNPNALIHIGLDWSHVKISKPIVASQSSSLPYFFGQGTSLKFVSSCAGITVRLEVSISFHNQSGVLQILKFGAENLKWCNTSKLVVLGPSIISHGRL